MPNPVSRRVALGALGIGVAAGPVAFAAVPRSTAAVVPGTPGIGPVSGITTADWIRGRGAHYLIAHRGSGDVLPEHSMEAYQAAVSWGAQCLEISVGMTSDGVLICMHDATYDRTTTTTGRISELPSAVLRRVRIDLPQLGPSWTTNPQPAVPLFEDVLRTLGGRVILCVEAKDGDAYPSMMAMVQRYGLGSSVMVKLAYNSGHLADAKSAGYPVFGYLGSAEDATANNITALAAKLNPLTDCLVLPSNSYPDYLDDALVATAVQTGIPVWVFPMHRRVDVAHFFGLGVAGAVCSSYGYLSRSTPIATADIWAYGAVAPGEMTRSPGSAKYAPTWSNDELTLGVQTDQHFLTLGQLCPLSSAAGDYTIEFEASWPTMPTVTDSNLSLVFGHLDDRYYEHESGFGDGYHAILRADGRLELYRHRDGVPVGTSIGDPVATPPPTAGQWIGFRLQVTPRSIAWTRTDVTGAVVNSTDTANRGGYLHLGRSSNDGALAFRKLTVS